MTSGTIDAAAPVMAPGLRRRVATAAVMAGLVVTAFEGSVVTPAMPTIAKDLGGYSLYAWVFTGYLLASTLAVPLSGKLADRVGRRPVFVTGMALFLAGSVLCGAATSMPALVAFRVLQGLGVGAIAPIGTTISADLYSLEERAKVHGLFTASWGLANVAGPPLGGAIVQVWGWRYVFFVNVPFGALAVLLLVMSYVDPPRARRGFVDVTSALVAAVALGASLLAADRGAPGGVPGRVALAVLGLAAGATFLRREARSSDPIVPRDALADPFVRAGAIGSLFVGAIIYAPTAYVPLWIARDEGGDALRAGSALVPMLVGWSIGSTLGVRVLVKKGIRYTATRGLTIALVGAVLLAAVVHGAAPHAVLYVALALLGLGLGPAANSLLLGSQMRVPWQTRGVVTSSVHAGRALGGSIAVATLAALGDADASAARFTAFAAIVAVGVVVALRIVPEGGVLTAAPQGDADESLEVKLNPTTSAVQ
ncbi:MAG TPA: MFS transporter [Byssovorax sp.]|jgi:MFS family permease